jgi:nucleoside-diphosphate-sugar epimerase
MVTGATGFLGWRSSILLADRGHEVVATTRPAGTTRAAAGEMDVVEIDAGDPRTHELIAGCDCVLHFAGVPDPIRAGADPAAAVRENVGTTLNLLEGCRRHGAGLIYPSSVRASLQPPPDAYAVSKRLGEEACRLHRAPATVVRLTSVFGPGQVAREGATGAIASFADRALEGSAIVIPGDPNRGRDFVHVDDVVPALEQIASEGRWEETVTISSGVSTPLVRAAELVRGAAGSSSPVETPGGDLPPGENQTYEAVLAPSWLQFQPRGLEEGIEGYVDWLRRHPATQSSA